MNIALFASRFYPHSGGVEEVVRQIAHEEARQGNNPIVITNLWPKSLSREEVFEGIPVKRYNFRVPQFGFKQKVGAALFGPGTLRTICDGLKDRNTQIIHAHCVSSNAYYALRIKRRLNIPLLVTIHGELTNDETGLFRRNKFARDQYLDVLNNADAVTANSRSTFEETQRFFGSQLKASATVVSNGVRIEDFSKATPYPHSRPYILSVGRMVPQKGFDVLLRAFALFLRKHDTHDLILAGDGIERANLERMAAELKISGRVSFLGDTPHDITAGLFKGCSFFALPSRAEAFGIVFLEAMAAEKAVVASLVGGVPEVVLADRTGLLVPTEDAEALSAAMSRLITDDVLRTKLGEAGRLRAESFSWPVIIERYNDIYDKLLNSS